MKSTYDKIVGLTFNQSWNWVSQNISDYDRSRYSKNINNITLKISFCYRKVQVNIQRGFFFSQTRFFSHHYAQCGPLLIEMSHFRSNCAGVFPPLSFCALLAGYFWHTWAPCSCEFHFRQSLRLPSSLCMFIVTSYPAFCILDFPEPP